jgi:hypothetical protein
MRESILKALNEGIENQRWQIVGYGGSWSKAIAPLQQYIERKVLKAVVAERKACADICDGIIYHDGKEADKCAAAIRARSKK